MEKPYTVTIPKDVLEKAIKVQEEFIRVYRSRYNEEPEFDLIILAIMKELQARKEKSWKNL